MEEKQGFSVACPCFPVQFLLLLVHWSLYLSLNFWNIIWLHCSSFFNNFSGYCWGVLIIFNLISKTLAQSDAPLVGNTAPDFEAEAVFDQEFINVSLRIIIAIELCSFYASFGYYMGKHRSFCLGYELLTWDKFTFPLSINLCFMCNFNHLVRVRHVPSYLDNRNAIFFGT